MQSVMEWQKEYKCSARILTLISDEYESSVSSDDVNRLM